MRTASPAGCLKSSYRILSIRPDSPGPEVSNTICFIGETMLTANRAIESASQPKIAFLRLWALQRAMRAAMFDLWLGGPCLLGSGSSWMIRVFTGSPSRLGATQPHTLGSGGEDGRLAV